MGGGGGGGKGGAPSYNPKRDLKQATQTYLKFLPQLLAKESEFRQQYDPQRIEEQQGLQSKYGPTQYAQQLEALHTLDPQSAAIRGKLAQSVYGDLSSGIGLTPGLQQYVNSQIGAREAATGNELGNSAISSGALYAGNAAQQLYQQHIQNAQGFLAGPTPEQQLLAVQPVAPDRSSAYVNPGAPAQMSQNAYQNYLAQYQASGGGQTPGWVGLSGQIVGAAVGGYMGGIGGAQLGSSVGGAASTGTYNLFSDARLKSHIVYVGRSPSKLPIYEFCYKNDHQNRYRGTIAQEIMRLRPDAVTRMENGFYYVNYNKIDIPFEKVENVGEVQHAGALV